MSKLKNFSPKDKRIYKVLILTCIFVCIIMGIACFAYYEKLQDTVQTESNEFMREISNQMRINANKTIHDNFSVLETLSSVLQNMNITSYSQFRTAVQEQKKNWNYQKILLIDENGIAHDEQGKTVALASDGYLEDVIVGKKPALSSSQSIGGKECIVFAIPIKDLLIGDTKMLALAAIYDLSTFDKLLAMTAFEEKSYAHIIRKDGTIVIRSSSREADQSGYNILNSLAQARMESSSTLDKIKADIAGEKSGRAEYTFNGIRKYMTYTPLETQQWFLLTFVPSSVINARSDLLLKITFLLCSLVTIAFSLLTAFLLLTFYRNKRKLEQIAYVDPITGGNTIQRFYELAQTSLKSSKSRQYALVYTNIEKFKILNEQFGRDACDDILRGIEYGISENIRVNECLGRLSADNFCVLTEYENEEAIAARFGAWYQACADYLEKNNATLLPLIIEFGVYVINNNSMPFPFMTDRAKLALTEKTRELRGKLRYAIYDEQLRRLIFREKQLEDRMETALQNQEFQVYLQPKYRTLTEQVGGAEALVRWVSVSEGMIYPDEFISLFEKNGFIIQLDLWVFEKVCQTVRKWLDAGCDPVKLSVNCSRMHLKNPRFFDQYRSIAAKYDIPPNLIEIELTETTVFNNVEQLTQTIEEIHQSGFGCSMDDFGSGYSSLNLIQNIPVDTLKLDKIFFRSTSKDVQRTESIVNSVISMAKALSMETVAEGVEHRFQVDMLKRLHCDYIQGYIFAKPMPIQEFEQLVFPALHDIAEHGAEASENVEKI